MLKPSLLQFRTKYRVPPKADIIIGFMSSFMPLRRESLMRRLASTTTLPTAYTIGFIASPQKAWLDSTKANGLAVQRASLPLKSRGYTKTYCGPPENLATTRISGMDHCFPITCRNSIPYTWGSDNVRTFSIVLISHYNDLADKQLRLTQKSKRHLKKIPKMDKRDRYRGLGRGRSPFSESYKSHSYLGSQRPTTSDALCFHSPEGWLLWSSKLEDWAIGNRRGFHLQYRDISPLSLLFPQLHSRPHSPNSRQCQLSQGSKAKTVLHSEPASPSDGVPTPIFSRTQSYRTCLENYPEKSNSQPVFPNHRGTQRSSDKPIFSMGASQ